jgi:ATP-dependent Clp protease ATP-binding subunit ClpA
VEKGYDAAFGARPLRRAIQNHVEDPLAEGLLTGRFHPGDTVVATAQDGALVLEAQPRPASSADDVAVATAGG